MHRSVTFTMAGSNVAVPKATAAPAPPHKRHRTGMMYDTPEKFEAYYGISLDSFKEAPSMITVKHEIQHPIDVTPQSIFTYANIHRERARFAYGS